MLYDNNNDGDDNSDGDDDDDDEGRQPKSIIPAVRFGFFRQNSFEFFRTRLSVHNSLGKSRQ